MILGITGLMGIGLMMRNEAPQKTPYQPQFHVKECFTFDRGIPKGVTGVIKVIGEHEYTVLWYKEADRRYAGPKMGHRLPMRWLDMYALRVKCPQGW